MEFVSLDRIMDRLLVSPAMQSLGYATAAAYVKDFSSINDIQPIMDLQYAYVQVSNYKAEIPANCMRMENIYSCQNLPAQFFEDNKLGASLTDSIMRDKDKSFYGAYRVKDNILFTDDSEDGNVYELQYVGLRVDENGFPMLPYDGSLMMAVTNFVKWQYFSMLGESNGAPKGIAQEAKQNYFAYIGQYASKSNIPTYDEAVSWANSWQRLLDTRNQGYRTKHLRQGNLRQRRVHNDVNGYQNDLNDL